MKTEHRTITVNVVDLVAFYLPQFHPIPENDDWWGKGYTEWRSVGSAKSLFHGHKQPRVPADLGYYDLRVPAIRFQQAEMAKYAGIKSFCYWHYWFGNGKMLLEKPFESVLADKAYSFPFCLGWANESWKAKTWSFRTSKPSRTLIAQEYCGDTDDLNHFTYLKPAFLDERYFRIDGCPLFFIYKPEQHPYLAHFMDYWNSLLRRDKIADHFHFCVQLNDIREKAKYIQLGADSVYISPNQIMQYGYANLPKVYRGILKAFRFAQRRPIVLDYAKSVKYFSNSYNCQETVIPGILPRWDHSPRSGQAAVILNNSTPEKFRAHIQEVKQSMENKKNRLVFLKSWNEWGEGNYVEPDTEYGWEYLDAIKAIIKDVNSD